MTTPGFGNNPLDGLQDHAPAPAAPVSETVEQRNLVPIICAIAILIALTISGFIIWNDVRSTSQTIPSENETQDSTSTPIKEESDSKTNSNVPEESTSALDVPQGLTAGGWSDFPEARCQEREEMVFAAAGSDPDAHIVVCESKDSLFYRGVWSSGAAFGPAKGEGTEFSVAILDPTSGADTGSVLKIHGNSYDIDGDTGVFDVYWPKS